MANKKNKVETVKLETRWISEDNNEFVRRVQYVGQDVTEQWFLKTGSTWYHSDITTYTVNGGWSLGYERNRMFEVSKFTPVKGIRTFNKTK